MSRNSEDELEKVYVDLPNHWAVGGESMWAKPLGSDLYEIHNIPFYAYGLNYFDIVKVDSSDETKKPVVLEVVDFSGFQTLRVSFDENFDQESQTRLFEELKNFKVDVERANENYVALSIEPGGDYDAAYDKLLKLEETGVLEFETCASVNSKIFDAAADK